MAAAAGTGKLSRLSPVAAAWKTTAFLLHFAFPETRHELH
jgi:hypothetical protein